MAVRKGYNVVLSPSDHIYFDYPQAVGEAGAPWEGNDNGPNSLKLIYNWQPVPDAYSGQETSRIKGIEGAIWTEFIRSEHYMKYMVFPRLAALSEIAWRPKRAKKFDAFQARMKQQYKRYEFLGIKYRKPSKWGFHGGNSSQYMTH